MVRRGWLVVVVGLLLVSAALADLPLPNNLKYVDPRVRFEGVEKHADHVFYLRYLTFTGGPASIPHSLLQVKDANAFNLNAQRRLLDMSLLALQRKEFERRAKDDPSLKWLNDKTEGVLRANVVTPSTTAPTNIKEVPVTTYRVALKDGKLTVEMVPNQKRGEESPLGLLPTWGLGIVSAVVLAWLGIWLARRGATRQQPVNEVANSGS